MVWQRLTMQNASSVVFSHNAFSGPNVCSVIFSTAGKPQHPPLATEARTQAATTLTRAIGPQWAAVWRGVRDPLSAPWASSPGGVVWFIGQGGAGPRHLAAAVGKPADSMENVIQDRGDVVNRSGWTDGRSTPYPLWRIGHPQNPPLHPVVGRKGCRDRNPAEP